MNHKIKILRKMSFTSSRLHRRTGLLLMMITVNQETEETSKYNMKDTDHVILILTLTKII